MQASAFGNPSSRPLPLLVGREREQAMLRQALDDMLGGHGWLVLVSGAAGIGNPTLVDWLALRAVRGRSGDAQKVLDET